MRKFPTLVRRGSAGEPPDERSPLLARSRVRIQGTQMSPGPPYLSRNQSHTGNATRLSFIQSSIQPPSSLRRPTVPDKVLTSARLHPGSIRTTRHHSRQASWGQRLIQALADRQESLAESKGSMFPDERVWYDQFTSTDWVHDNIADAYRVKALRSRRDFWGRVYAIYDASQGWILSGVCGFVIAVIAYTVDVSEATVFDYKAGYCARGWFLSEKVCDDVSGSHASATVIQASRLT